MIENIYYSEDNDKNRSDAISSNTNHSNYSQETKPRSGNVPWFIKPEYVDTSSTDSTITKNKPSSFEHSVPISQKKHVANPSHQRSNPSMQNNNSYGDYIYNRPRISIDNLGFVGLSPRSAQKLNADIVSAGIEIDKQHAINAEKFSYMIAVDEYKRMKGNETGMLISNNGEIIPLPTRVIPHLKEFESHYHELDAIVKIRSRYTGAYSYMKRSTDYNRHVVVSEEVLKQDYLYDLEDMLPSSENMSQNQKESSFRRMRHYIPKLQDTNLRILDENEIMFKDGFLNLENGIFTRVDKEQQHNYFNVFSIEIDFRDGKYTNPSVFDSFLHMILNNDECACKGVYQMIGSILAPAPSLKKCYLFQGVSNSGKTTLVNYIMDLMPYEDVLEKGTVADLTDDSLSKHLDPIRLIHIQELGSNKLASKQITSIKAFVDGSHRKNGSSSFKLIMTTNNKVITGNDGFIESALKNRLLVIPFPKAVDFDNADPNIQALGDVHFDLERRSIILKALQAYTEVIRNNGKFCCNYEVNAVIDNPEKSSETLTNNERTSLATIINEQPAMQPAIDEIFDKCFILLDHINPEMTTEVIMDVVNSVRNGLLANSASTGRKLQEHFGDSLKLGRPHGVTAYNLGFKDQQDIHQDNNDIE